DSREHDKGSDSSGAAPQSARHFSGSLIAGEKRLFCWRAHGGLNRGGQFFRKGVWRKTADAINNFSFAVDDQHCWQRFHLQEFVQSIRKSDGNRPFLASEKWCDERLVVVRVD